MQGDLWVAAHIEKPARIALPPTVGGSDHIGRTISDIEQMHGALFSRFAPHGGELEEACRAVCVASVGTSSRQMVQQDGEIAQSVYFLWHGSLPFLLCSVRTSLQFVRTRHQQDFLMRV